jgi:hypothetical protein
MHPTGISVPLIARLGVGGRASRRVMPGVRRSLGWRLGSEDMKKVFLMASLISLAIYMRVDSSLASDSSQASGRQCPVVIVQCPDDISKDTWTYTVHVRGAEPGQKLTYKWAVSCGEIESGQGTRSITVRRPEKTEGFSASVEVGGLPEGCDGKASCYTTH